jgi:hypothetical protein
MTGPLAGKVNELQGAFVNRSAGLGQPEAIGEACHPDLYPGVLDAVSMDGKVNAVLLLREHELVRRERSWALGIGSSHVLGPGLASYAYLIDIALEIAAREVSFILLRPIGSVRS